MFIAALFVTGKNWKYLVPLKYLKYIHIREYYKAIKINHNINGKSHKHHNEGKEKPDIREHTQYDSNYEENIISLIYDNRKRLVTTFQETEGGVGERRHVRVLFGYWWSSTS